MTANIITLSRIVFSALLLVFSPDSAFFTAFYILCGVTDVLDGFIARRLHTASETGAKLDSAADLVFAAVYAVRILPLLHIPFWAWLCAAIIAAIKATGIIIAGIKMRGLSIEHSPGNRLTGLLIFLMPLSVRFADVKYTAAIVCAAAAVTAIAEIIKIIEVYRGKGQKEGTS